MNKFRFMLVAFVLILSGCWREKSHLNNLTYDTKSYWRDVDVRFKNQRTGYCFLKNGRCFSYENYDNNRLATMEDVQMSWSLNHDTLTINGIGYEIIETKIDTFIIQHILAKNIVYLVKDDPKLNKEHKFE